MQIVLPGSNFKARIILNNDTKAILVMKKIDFLALDGRLIRLFLTVYDCLSITRSAELLDTTQSNVSHGLDRLRLILNDPLFIRAGRGMSATEEAERLVPAMRQLLNDMGQLVEPRVYQPLQDQSWFTVAGNDFEIEAIVSPLYMALKQQAPEIRLRVLQLGSTAEITHLLRQGKIDLILAPTITSNADDLRQQLLFEDPMTCFFDANTQQPPTTLKRYLGSPHVQIGFGGNIRSMIDQMLEAKGEERKVALEVSRFYALPQMIEGSRLIATLPSRLTESIFAELDQCSCPLDIPAMKFYQYWHERNNNSPRHRWFRKLIKQVSAP